MYVQSRGCTGRDRRSLVEFDLWSIPYHSTIVSATLNLYASTVPKTTRTYELYRITSDWTELGVEWQNQPAIAGQYSDTATTPGSAEWMTWDVTADVQAMMNGTVTNYGWLVKDSSERCSETQRTAFLTREHYKHNKHDTETGLRPVLEITYQAP